MGGENYSIKTTKHKEKKYIIQCKVSTATASEINFSPTMNSLNPTSWQEKNVMAALLQHKNLNLVLLLDARP